MSATSWVYRSALVYESVMLVLYGRHYFARYRAVADLIPRGASVLDVCCGPAHLYYGYLRGKSASYCGVDVNARFIARLRRGGAEGHVCDVAAGQALPPADYVVMQGSLHQFLPDAARIVDRMLGAARRQVIVAEPIRNLSTSRVPLLASFARRQTNPGLGLRPHRFTEQTLDELFAAYRSRVSRSFLIPGGREKVYVLDAGRSDARGPD
jgi:SAM-dependent methyltransferase